MNCVNLTYKNFKDFRNFYYKFKNHEVDFFKTYSSSNLYKRISMRKNVTIIVNKEDYIGYIWIKRMSPKKCTIIEKNIVKDYDKKSYYKILLGNLRDMDTISFKTQKYDYLNFSLTTLGYCNFNNIFEMEYDLNNEFEFNERNDLSLRLFIKGIDENIRCKLQNSIFEKNGRKKLTVRDIYYDEIQKYYYKEGVIFLLKDYKEIGLGQIIIENDIPVLVNFGIEKKYRGNGYSKYLLNYILKYLKDKGETKLLLRVDANNNIAINLYKSIGFIIKQEYYNYVKTNERIAVE